MTCSPSCVVRMFLIGAVFAPFAARAHAQEQSGDPLARCVREASTALTERGFPATEMDRGFLTESHTAIHVDTLPADGCFGYLVVGHDGVRDLDLALHTTSGLALGSDVSVDKLAYVRYCGAEGLEVVATVQAYEGRGEYRLLRLENAPAQMPELDRNLGGCFAGRVGLRGRPPDIGPAPVVSAAELLEQWHHDVEHEGYRRVGPTRHQSGQPNAAVRLDAQRCYALLVAASPETDQIALQVLSPQGRVIVRDEASGRRIRARFCTEMTGDFTVQVGLEGGAWSLAPYLLEEKVAAPTPLTAVGRFDWAVLATRLARRGMRTRALAWGFASAGERLAVPVTLRGGRCYAFSVVRGDALARAGMDVTVAGAEGELVSWSIGGQPPPTAYHCPERDGIVRMRVRPRGGVGRFLLVLGEEDVP